MALTRTSTKRRILNGLAALSAVGLALSLGAVAEAAPSAKLTQFRIPTANSSPREIAQTADGNLWFTQSFLNDQNADPQSVGRITPQGDVTEFAVCSFCFPGDIVQGSDANLYFTKNDAPLGRITTGGTVLPDVGTPFQFNGGSVAAHGDDIWVTDFNNHSLWRYDIPSGQLTEFPTDPAVTPFDVIVAPDGTVWFTDVGSEGQIGRLVPSTGTFTMVDVEGLPRQINLASDGAVWFTERFTPQGVGRIDPVTLAVSQFAVDGGPEDIAPGANGTMWFTRSTAGNIAQISASGVILAQSKTVKNSTPFGITVSADGDPWFTMLDANKIAKLDVTP